MGINQIGKYYVQFILSRSAGVEEDYDDIDYYDNIYHYESQDMIDLYTRVGILTNVRFKCSFQIEEVPANEKDDVELSKEEPYYSYQDSNTEAIYYKVNHEKDGALRSAITVTSPSGTGYIKVTLLDKDKKVLLKEERLKYVEEKYVNSNVSFIYHLEGNNTVNSWWALSKGIYYIKVEAQCGIYSISYNSNAANEKSGTTKKNAKALKLKNTAYDEREIFISFTETMHGVCTLSDKKDKTDWYRFEVKKPTDIYFWIKGTSVGNIMYDIYDASGYSLLKGPKKIDGSDGESRSYIFGELKGTYYFKVIKGDKKGYCEYSVNITQQPESKMRNSK